MVHRASQAKAGAVCDVPKEVASTAVLRHYLGIAYSDLPGGDREKNLQQAVTCFTQALEVLQSLHMDSYADVVQKNLDQVPDAMQRPNRDQ